LLDNCAALLEFLQRSSERFGLSQEKVRSAAVEVALQQTEVRRFYEVAIRKPPPLDSARLLAAQQRSTVAWLDRNARPTYHQVNQALPGERDEGGTS
jgi:benzoyl-CoA reductase/2-hydroxyglutaryl-CoA dehydratase subunit BcrC/BadD/HgdB